MRTTTWPRGAVLLLAGVLALAGCSDSPPAGTDGTGPAPDETTTVPDDVPAEPAPDPVDPDAEEPPSDGSGGGGGEVDLPSLPIGVSQTFQPVDGVACIQVFAILDGVLATVEQVRMTPDGTVVLDGPCASSGGPACRGLRDADPYSCEVAFRPPPDATEVTVELLGTLTCVEPGCAQLQGDWGAQGGERSTRESPPETGASPTSGSEGGQEAEPDPVDPPDTGGDEPPPPAEPTG